MPVYEDELGFLQWRDNMRAATQAARASATPELGANVKSLMRDFPWLQPGTAYGMAKANITGEKAWKVAAYDLYYQANETDRFGKKQAVTSPQERLLAWEKQLRQEIRQEKQRRKLDEKAGSAFGDASQVTENEARVARFGDMDLSEIRAMRRTVRGALATGDPVTMGAVLSQIQARSAVEKDPYDISQQSNPIRRGMEIAGAGMNLTNKILTTADDKVTGGTIQGGVRAVATAANMGIEGLAAAERGIVAAAGDSIQGAKNFVGIAQGQPIPQVTSTPAVPGFQERREASGQGAYLSPLAILKQTQGGQALIDLVQGNPVDLGSGWLPSYESETAKAAAQASREYSPYLIGGHAWTIGRAIADVARLEPDTTPFTIVSGAVDAWQAWQLDPANFALSALANANRARKVFDLDEAGNVVSRVNAIEDALAGVDNATDVVPRRRWWAVDRVFDTEEEALEYAARFDDSYPRALVFPEQLEDVVVPLDDAAKAAQRAEILRDAGVGVGRRPILRSKNPVDWLYGQGTPVVKAIAEESDPWTIYWAFNGRIPIKSDTGQNVLEALARAQDEGEVRRVLASELGTSLDRVPKWRGGVTGRPPPRLLSDMPGRVINPDDPDGVAHTLINYLKLSKVPVEDQQRIFNQWVMAEGRGDRYAAVDAAYDAIEAQLRAAGRGKLADLEAGGIRDAVGKAVNRYTRVDVTDDEIRNLLRRSKKEWDEASRYGVDAETGVDKPLMLPDENGNLVEVAGPRWEKERWNTAIILPDPQEIRRLVANPAWKKIVNSGPWGAAIALADGYMDLWKFAVLIRGAWPVRVIGDEMLRMSAVGESPFMHPVSYLAQVSGNPNDSRLMNLLSRLGKKPTEEAVTAIFEERSRRLNQLLDDGVDIGEARAMVNKELPVPQNFGKRWAETLRRGKTRVGQNSVDISNAPFDPNDLYGEALTSRVIGSNQSQLGTAGLTRKVYLDHFDVVDRSSGTWSRGLVGELYRIFSDEVTTRALRMNTDDFLEGLWAEEWGRSARRQMAAGRESSDPWVRVLNDRAASDQYGREILDQLENFHQGDQRLIDAMRSGNFTYIDEFGDQVSIPLTYGGHPSDEAIDFAKRLQAEGVGPENLKVQRQFNYTVGRRERDVAQLDAYVNGAFDFLMTKPSNYLTRSVTFRGKYWDEAERLIPAMDRDAQSALRKTLESANISKDRKAAILSRLDDTSAGNLTLEQADDILKRRALDHTRELLYDLHKRGQFFDAARLVFPFGEAWKEVITTWGRIIKDNPNSLRRAQQIIQGAREAEVDPVTGLPTGQGEGFFRYDPQTGQEVFTYPLSSWLSQQSVNIPFLGKIGPDSPVPVPMRGAVQSLNMVASGLPGIGPVVQIPASEIIPKGPAWDGVRSQLFPFGEPEGDGAWDKFLSAIKSNWGKRVERAAADPRTDRMKGNMVFDVMSVLVSTGEYDIVNDEDAVYELNRLYHDAREKANGLSWLSALGAFTLPASPGYDFYAEDKTGNLVLLQQLRDEWNEKRNKLYDKGVPNASQEAFRWFINQYGTDNIFATQAKSTLKVVGLEPTKEMRRWERENPDAVTNFPQTWGLFAPKGGEFNYDAYVSQIDVGYRDPMTPETAARAAISRRADAMYAKFRKMAPDVPNREQSAWLRQVREAIATQFPGSTPGAYGGDEDSVARITELQMAAKDPKLSKTELGEALGIYFDARDRANQAALANPKGESSSIESSGETQALRDWLYGVADELAAEYDGFAEAWEQVLSREFKD